MPATEQTTTPRGLNTACARCGLVILADTEGDTHASEVEGVGLCHAWCAAEARSERANAARRESRARARDGAAAEGGAGGEG